MQDVFAARTTVVRAKHFRLELFSWRLLVFVAEPDSSCYCRAAIVVLLLSRLLLGTALKFAAC